MPKVAAMPGHGYCVSETRHLSNLAALETSCPSRSRNFRGHWLSGTCGTCYGWAKDANDMSRVPTWGMVSRGINKDAILGISFQLCTTSRLLFQPKVCQPNSHGRQAK